MANEGNKRSKLEEAAMGIIAANAARDLRRAAENTARIAEEAERREQRELEEEEAEYRAAREQEKTEQWQKAREVEALKFKTWCKRNTINFDQLDHCSLLTTHCQFVVSMKQDTGIDENPTTIVKHITQFEDFLNDRAIDIERLSNYDLVLYHCGYFASHEATLIEARKAQRRADRDAFFERRKKVQERLHRRIRKTRWRIALLALLLGATGVHRLMTRRIPSGSLMAFAFGFWCLWLLDTNKPSSYANVSEGMTVGQGVLLVCLSMIGIIDSFRFWFTSNADFESRWPSSGMSLAERESLIRNEWMDEYRRGFIP